LPTSSSSIKLTFFVYYRNFHSFTVCATIFALIFYERCVTISALISYCSLPHKAALPLVTKRLTVRTTHRGAVGTRGVLRAIEGSLRTAGRLIVRRAVGAVRKLAAAAKRVGGQPREEVVQPRGGGAGDETAAGVQRGAGHLREEGRLNHCDEAFADPLIRPSIQTLSRVTVLRDICNDSLLCTYHKTRQWRRSAIIQVPSDASIGCSQKPPRDIDC
jgi:hypothetical protein